MELAIAGFHLFPQEVRIEPGLAVALVQVHELGYFAEEENNLILAQDLLALDVVLIEVLLVSDFFGLLEDADVVLEGEPVAEGAAIEQQHGEL